MAPNVNFVAFGSATCSGRREAGWQFAALVRDCHGRGGQQCGASIASTRVFILLIDVVADELNRWDPAEWLPFLLGIALLLPLVSFATILTVRRVMQQPAAAQMATTMIVGSLVCSVVALAIGRHHYRLRGPRAATRTPEEAEYGAIGRQGRIDPRGRPGVRLPALVALLPGHWYDTAECCATRRTRPIRPGARVDGTLATLAGCSKHRLLHRRLTVCMFYGDAHRPVFTIP
jgi:hypothetical protein